MSDARGNGGIQAYKGHSTYVRGRKIRIDIPQTQPEQPELELTPDAEPTLNEDGEPVAAATPDAPEVQK